MRKTRKYVILQKNTGSLVNYTLAEQCGHRLLSVPGSTAHALEAAAREELFRLTGATPANLDNTRYLPAKKGVSK